MVWNRLEKLRKRGRPKASDGARLSLRVLASGLVKLRVGLGKGLLQRLGENWQAGLRLEVCLGGGADRGWLRLMPAEDGDFHLQTGGGRGKGSAFVMLTSEDAFEEAPGRYPVPPQEIQETPEGALLLRLPEQIVRAKARAVP